VARLPYVDAADAAEPVRDALGRVPPLNIFRMMANAETAFRPWLRWGATLLGELELDPRLRELAILRVARLTPHAEYEWIQHVPNAKAVGATDEQVAALERDDPEASCFSDDDRAVLSFTTEVVRDAQASDSSLDRLAQILGPREIVELLMVIGQYMMVARVMATTRMELDEPVDPRDIGAR
jgi:4-carboxymuconolactone decarboxylase